MKEYPLSEVEAFACEILNKYYCECDVEFLNSTFAEDIVWIGAGEGQKAEGKEAVTAYFTQKKRDMAPWDVSYEIYETRRLGSDCYLCEGSSRISFCKRTEMLLDNQQRFTFIFRDNGGKLETIHIHNLMPYPGWQEAVQAAIFKVYPLILKLNLTQDTYRCFSEEEIQFIDKTEGVYSEIYSSSLPGIHPEHRDKYASVLAREKLMERFSRGEREVYLDFQQEGTNGEYGWRSVCVIQMENPFSPDVMAIGLVKVQDTQKEKQEEQEQLLRGALQSANASSLAKSDFLSRISHDIRTSMNGIVGMSAIGQRNLQKPDTVLECFQKIDASSKYLFDILNDILDVSKLETGKMELISQCFSLQVLLEEVNHIITPQAKGRRLIYEEYKKRLETEYYVGDAARIKQILINLLSNSLKFTPAGGKVIMSVRQEDENYDLSFLEFCICDTGIGISEAFLQRIFQPFEREIPEVICDNPGSGLGLSIAYSLVHLMGGTIEADSKKGEGTQITVRLPLAPVYEEETVYGKNSNSWWEEEESEDFDFYGYRVLLAEDNELNREIACTLLEMNGIEVETAENGQEAVDMFSENPPGYYMAILMDIRMPVMDGLESTCAIRALDRGDAQTIPIIAMTANAFQEDEEEARKIGMDGYLVKPLEVDAIFRELRHYV